MATTIVGVDFSGAIEKSRSTVKTWVAQGHLEDGSLWLDKPQQTYRRELYELVAQLPPPAVVAMDFPFGVPAAFAKHVCGDPRPLEMPDVWSKVGAMSKAMFIYERDKFVPTNGELKRYGDAVYRPESISVLKTGGPNMMPMTYEGIRLLHRWHQNYPQRWNVPPLSSLADPEDEKVTLLEVMPGALLKARLEALALPPNGHKQYKGKSIRAMQLRATICDGLGKAIGICLPNLDSVRSRCIDDDDCLDAVVAAVCAAAWVHYPASMHRPVSDIELDAILLGKLRWPAEHNQRTELDAARLEGWIYTLLPNKQAEQGSRLTPRPPSPRVVPTTGSSTRLPGGPPPPTGPLRHTARRR